MAYDVDVDIHLDVGPSAEELDIYLVCELTDQIGWGGRVAISYGPKYAATTPADLRVLGTKIADSGVAVTVLPATDLYAIGRHQDHAVMRGVADANALAACGVNCCISTNNILNPFTPFGDSSLVRIANMYANVIQRGTEEKLAECFAMLTERPGKLLRRRDYGIAVGNPADLVVWDTASGHETVVKNAQPLFDFKAGRATFTRTRPDLQRP